MTYKEFLDKYRDQIDSGDFKNPLFEGFYGSNLWKDLMTNLIKLGVNPLVGFNKVPSYFFSDSKIGSIVIPDSVTSIEYYAFLNCTKLTNVTIPDSVKSIEWGAFQNCISLTSITIPSNVTNIGYQAFSGCSSLTSIVIPDGVTGIEGYEFSGCSSLTRITIPDSVTVIEHYAFYDCSSLTSIYYKGTKQQFMAIKKGGSWKPEPLIEIKCSDGVIKI